MNALPRVKAGKVVVDGHEYVLNHALSIVPLNQWIEKKEYDPGTPDAEIKVIDPSAPDPYYKGDIDYFPPTTKISAEKILEALIGGEFDAGDHRQLVAPTGKFRVVTRDRLDGIPSIVDDTDTLELAQNLVRERSDPGWIFEIYDDQGRQIQFEE